MNPVAYLKGFAWLSFIALGLSIFTDFWFPMIVGGAAVALMLKWLKV